MKMVKGSCAYDSLNIHVQNSFVWELPRGCDTLILLTHNPKLQDISLVIPNNGSKISLTPKF